MTDAWKAILERLDKIDKRLNGIDKKQWIAVAALVGLLFTVIGWLLATSPPWN